jgi:hypothetical protein
MLKEMLLHSALKRRVDFMKILRAYRRIREELGDSQHEDFERELTRRAAALVGCGEAQVRSTAANLLERRPLRHLMRYQFPHLTDLFLGLRKHKEKIGILSDYPARDNLEAMELKADFMVCTTDEDVGVLIPHANGLLLLMSRAYDPCTNYPNRGSAGAGWACGASSHGSFANPVSQSDSRLRIAATRYFQVSV